MADLSDFERGQIVGMRLAGLSVTKTAKALGVSRATVSKVMSAYTSQGKTTSARKNSGRKSKLTESDRCRLRRIVLENRKCTAAQVTAELNVHLQQSVSTKTVRRELHKSNIRGQTGLHIKNQEAEGVMVGRTDGPLGKRCLDAEALEVYKMLCMEMVEGQNDIKLKNFTKEDDAKKAAE